MTDAQHRGPLAAIRCLSNAGYRVGAVANTRLAPGLWSRACSAGSLVPPVDAGAEPFIAQLVKLLSGERYDALIPGTDLSLYVISRHRGRLEPFVTLGLPSHDAVQRALDKDRLAVAATAAGIATPAAAVCDGPREAAAAAHAFGYPVLVKPKLAVAERAGQLLHDSTGLAANETQVREFQRQLGVCIVQQRIIGPVVSLAGVSTDRALLGSVLIRHHRTWPPRAGSASFVESIDADPGLNGRVQALVQAIGWRGVWQLQFIEGADGVLHAIDFNPRPFGCMGVAEAAGVPLMALWCDFLLARRPSPTTAPVAARPGVRWRMEDLDARNILWQLRRGCEREAFLATLPRRGTAHAYFRWRDPLPLVMRAAELGARRWRRSVDRDVRTAS